MLAAENKGERGQTVPAAAPFYLRSLVMNRFFAFCVCPALAILTAAAALVPTGCNAQSVAEPGVQRPAAGPFEYLAVDDAWQAAQESQVPMLLFVTSDHCYYCKKMVAETYTHPELAPAFAKLFETVAVEQADNPQLVEQLGVRMFPTTLIVSPAGSLLGRLEGHVPAENIGEKLNPILQDYRESLVRQTKPQQPQQLARGGVKNR